MEVHRNALNLKEMSKIEDGQRLGQVRIEYFLTQKIPDKIIGTKWGIPVKLERKRKV